MLGGVNGDGVDGVGEGIDGDVGVALGGFEGVVGVVQGGVDGDGVYGVGDECEGVEGVVGVGQ